MMDILLIIYMKEKAYIMIYIIIEVIKEIGIMGNYMEKGKNIIKDIKT